MSSSAAEKFAIGDDETDIHSLKLMGLYSEELEKALKNSKADEGGKYYEDLKKAIAAYQLEQATYMASALRLQNGPNGEKFRFKFPGANGVKELAAVLHKRAADRELNSLIDEEVEFGLKIMKNSRKPKDA